MGIDDDNGAGTSAEAGDTPEYEPVETMQMTLPDGSITKRIVLDKDGAGMNVLLLTAYAGGEHDGRVYVELCSDAEHQNGTLLHQFLTRGQTDALRKWMTEK
jgi:hypothetical protein